MACRLNRTAYHSSPIQQVKSGSADSDRFRLVFGPSGPSAAAAASSETGARRRTSHSRATVAGVEKPSIVERNKSLPNW